MVDPVVDLLRRVKKADSAAGVVLLAATAVALIWANSPWSESYARLWESRLSLGLGGGAIQTDLRHLIDDALMAVFFFVMGLEIKREVLAGHLSSMRGAALPVLSALGGMLVPAAIYAAFTAGGPAVRGWGVPMATDIAFALAVLALLGNRVPGALRVLLAALAIADDIGAILVIALFYSEGIVWMWLAAAAGLLGAAAVANLAGVRRPGIYAALGVALWAVVLLSGIHATIAGVLLSLTIPVRTRLDEPAFLHHAHRALRDFDEATGVSVGGPARIVLSNPAHHRALGEIIDLADQAQPPLIRMEHALHGWVFFVIMPLFALANAGLSFSGLGAVMEGPVAPAVAIGLVIGKPVGIAGAAWLAVRAGLASLPEGVTWRMVVGVGLLGGIGFTMALFIATLAFGTGEELAAAKAGILGASLLAGLAGWLVLRTSARDAP